jgi:hypothetical protein
VQGPVTFAAAPTKLLPPRDLELPVSNSLRAVRRPRAAAVAILSAIAALASTPAAFAETVVAGAHSSDSGSLVIDPTPEGNDPFTVVNWSGPGDVAFVSRMPRTMTVDRVTLGPFSTWCTSQQTLTLYVREGTTGVPADTTQIRWSAPTVVDNKTKPRTFTLAQAATFVAGRSYLFRVGSSSGCSFFNIYTWGHNQPQVDGGTSRCAQGPTVIGTSGSWKRQWHVQGQADSSAACVTYPSNSSHFSPSMPTGWLVSYLPQDAWFIRHGTPNAGSPPEAVCGKGAPRNDYTLLGAIPLGWMANTPSDDYVCAWTQFAPFGTSVPDGWYHGLPWPSERGGAPRDVSIQLTPTSQYATLAQTFAPVLRFDTSEDQRPLNVDMFFAEGEHSICAPGGTACYSLNRQADLAQQPQPDAYIDIDGRVDDTGDAGSYRTPYADCDNGDLLDCDSGPRSAGYYRVTGPYYGGGTTGYRYIDYWYFYRVNDFAGTIGQHEGDWEGVTIAPAGGNVTNPTTFDYAALSQHGTFAAYLRDNLACEDTPAATPPSPGTCGSETTKFGKRLAVMVSHGGHANYPRACSEQIYLVSCRGTFSGLNRERGYDGARRWGRAFDDPTTALLAMPPDDGGPTGLNWLNWAGRWGKTDDGFEAPSSRGMNAPVSPLFQSVSIACAEIDNTGGCPGTTTPRATATRSVGASKTGWYKPSPGLVAARCDAWAGRGTSATICDPAGLRSAVTAGNVGRKSTMSVRVAGRPAGHGGRGITQVMGDPLAPGTQVSFGGSVSADTEVTLRVRGSSGSPTFATTYRLTGQIGRRLRGNDAARERRTLRTRQTARGVVPVLEGMQPVRIVRS